MFFLFQSLSCYHSVYQSVNHNVQIALLHRYIGHVCIVENDRFERTTSESNLFRSRTTEDAHAIVPA